MLPVDDLTDAAVFKVCLQPLSQVEHISRFYCLWFFAIFLTYFQGRLSEVFSAVDTMRVREAVEKSRANEEVRYPNLVPIFRNLMHFPTFMVNTFCNALSD